MTPEEFADLLSFKTWLIRFKNEGLKRHRDYVMEYELEDFIAGIQKDLDDQIKTYKKGLDDGISNE